MSVREARRADNESGFALVVVVFLLFAVGVSAAAAYQVIRSEDSIAGFALDSERALGAAKAGASIFMAETTLGLDSIATPGAYPNDTTFTLDDGLDNPPLVQVTARKLVDDMDWEDLYLVTSIGRMTDPRYFGYPAIREVKAVARMRTPPMETSPEPRGTLVATNPITENAPGNPWSGTDAGGCIAGNVNAQRENQSLTQIGAPPIASLTSMTVDYAWSGGGWSLPAGYPVVRVPAGTFTANTSKNGTGVLIVPGNLFIDQNWTWNGIVLIGGNVTTTSNATHSPVFRGMMVAGLTDPPGGTILISRGSYQYNSCHVLAAGRSMGALDPEPLSWWTGY